jgi:MFS family permease
MPGSSLAPLRHRPFRRIWIGSFVSNVGTWMETIALGRYVAETTHRAVWSGIIAAAGFLPTAVIGLLGGALADRLSKKRLLVGATVVQGLIAAVVTVLVRSDHATPANLAGLTLLAGCASAIGFPAFQASMPDLVPPEDLPGAIGLSSVQWNLGRVLGPVLAGIVIAAGDIPFALLLNTLSFLAVIVAVAPISIPRRPPLADRPPVLRTIMDGWGIVRKEPGLRVMNLTMCMNTLIAAPFIALIPAMVEKVLKAGRGANSVLVTAQGIGAVVAGLSMGSLVSRFGIRRTMVGSIGLLPIGLVLYGGAPNLWLMAPALLLVGGAYMAALSSFSTIGQTRAPAEYRGRVMAINNAVLGSLYPLGAVVQGSLGDRVGLRWVTAGSGLLLGLVLVGVWLIRRGATRALDTPANAEASTPVV